MQDWDLSSPPTSEKQDHDVQIVSHALAKKKIALFISGSIAAYRCPDLIRELRKNGASVKVFASKSALNFVSSMSLEWTSLSPVVSCLTADAEHLENNFDFDLFLAAPATYNSINKLAQGIADNALSTALACALGRSEQSHTPFLISPCMNGIMHNSILIESMKSLNSRGIQFLKPRQEDGKNKLPESAVIIDACIKSLYS